MTRVVAVRRSGGFAGMVRSGEVDLDSDDHRTEELAALVDQVDLPRGDAASSGSAPGRPDGFSYDFDLCGRSCALAEHELTPELRRIAALLLG